MFNLNVTHNGDENYNFKGPKKCYENSVDIIYGDASGFQFDLLRHEYSDIGTRGTRNFKNTISIIDEVDNMFIDDSSKIAILADSMSGMNSISIILTIIWQELYKIQKRFEKIEDKLIYHKPIQSENPENNGNVGFKQILV